MNKTLLSFAGWLLLIAAVAFYVLGIGKAVSMSWHPLKPEQLKEFPTFLSSSVSSLQAILITNLGALLGIATKMPNSAIAKQLMIFTGGGRSGINEIIPPLEAKEKIQLAGVILLILSFIGCMIVWIKRDFVEDNTILPTVVESGKMFIGIVLAYFTLILSKN
jgi:hypothetical protein